MTVKLAFRASIPVAFRASGRVVLYQFRVDKCTAIVLATIGAVYCGNLNLFQLEFLDSFGLEINLGRGEWNLQIATPGRKLFLVFNSGFEKPSHTTAAVIVIALAVYDIAAKIAIQTPRAFICL